MVERSIDETGVSGREVTAVASTAVTNPRDLDPFYKAIEPDTLSARNKQEVLKQAKPPKYIEITYCGSVAAASKNGAAPVSVATLEGSR